MEWKEGAQLESYRQSPREAMMVLLSADGKDSSMLNWFFFWPRRDGILAP